MKKSIINKILLLSIIIILAYSLNSCDSIHDYLNPPPAADQNASPVAVAGDDQTVKQGVTVNFDGSGSTDSDGTIASYDWDFGDGSTHGSGSTTSHVYSTTGTYAVILIVT